MEPYKVYMKSDLKKMILDIIKFDIIKEGGVTELLFFNEFHLTIYQYYKWVLFLQKGKKSIIVQHFSLCCWYKNWILF